ncbi:MAG: ferrous iron transport protein B [Turicibacter sp.]|nr:ferrous iron transport protein B [Turicibacter sp.]
MRLMLIGNPNVGKTTLFNSLTGSNAHVGNWSGVTVDKLVGIIKKTNDELIDLPGIYSVTPSSEDEGVVTYALLKESYQGILNIVDATHLKRNLHLTIQLLEANVPMLISMNMMDALQKKGLKLNLERLQELLEVETVLISARKNEGIDQVIEKIPSLAVKKSFTLYYGLIIETAIAKLIQLIGQTPKQLDPRWVAIQLLEGNEGIYQTLSFTNEQELRAVVSETEAKIIQEKVALSLKGAIFNKRREWIDYIYHECLETTELGSLAMKPMLTPVDRVLTHPILGAFIFLILMFLIYLITFDLVGNPLSDGFSVILEEWMIPGLAAGLTTVGVHPDGFVYGILIDGLMAGVGGIIVFLPQILILFFCLSLMEATGYMARVAIVMDYIFSGFGLNGKAIVPLITGFGCNVPAIMATRTIPDRKERIKTMMVIPFMSCSARLPVYVLFVGLFFQSHQSLIIMGLYLLGIVVALLSAKL